MCTHATHRTHTRTAHDMPTCACIHTCHTPHVCAHSMHCDAHACARMPACTRAHGRCSWLPRPAASSFGPTSPARPRAAGPGQAEGAAQMEQDKTLRKEPFISSLRIHYKQRQVLKMEKSHQCPQPTVKVSSGTERPAARPGPEPVPEHRRGRAEPRARGHRPRRARPSLIAGERTEPATQPHSMQVSRQAAAGARGARGHGGPGQCLGRSKCSGTRLGARLGHPARRPGHAGHTQGQHGPSLPTPCREFPGSGIGWCRASWARGGGVPVSRDPPLTSP